MRRTTTRTRTEGNPLTQARLTGENLPAVIGPDGVIEPEVLTQEQAQPVRIAVVGGEVTFVNLAPGTTTIRDLASNPKTHLTPDMEFFINGRAAGLDSEVRNGDAVVGLDRFDAGA
jgi:hypothetical protein